jgi:PAS domain S-box-containing protein
LTAAFLISLVWLVVVALAVSRLRQGDRIVVAVSGFGAALTTFGIVAWAERRRWSAPVRDLSHLIQVLRERGKAPPLVPPPRELAELTREILILARIARQQARKLRKSSDAAATQPPDPQDPPSSPSLTYSGLFDAPPQDPGSQQDPNLSGDYSTADMVNRLDPIGFRWIESSEAEQLFLGWALPELRQKSFLEILHPEDRPRAEEVLRNAIVRGEALGLIVRMRTAQSGMRAVEVNVGARYGTNQKVSHLRCHLTDVTDKVRAERELRLRTRELTQVNEQLRRINRELEELKDRYSNLYEHAPAMYLSLDLQGRVLECNQTMLATLNQTRDQIVGRYYITLLPPALRERFLTRFQTMLEVGSIEKESKWVKSTGEVIDVWIHGALVRGSKPSDMHARFVAQDVTAKRRLEAELREKNEHLAKANRELSQRNQELDEFAYAVSHDLQEPLRTLLAFSDLLLRDYGQRLDAEGEEYVRYLVDASRRMKAMIQGMLVLSRAGKVIGDFAAVDLEDLLSVIKTDLGELFRTKGGTLRIVGPFRSVWGDRDRIGQLLSNLITNGIKYNQSLEPQVEIGVASTSATSTFGDDADLQPGAEVTLYVKDNGIGIEPQFHATVFQLFRRLHTQDEYPGTGVGLAICSKIVHAHGGRIWVESAPGQGSTFFVRLRSGPSEGPPPGNQQNHSGSRPYHQPSLAGSDG